MTLPLIARVDAPRLWLRPVGTQDLPELLAINGDAQTTRFLPYRAWESLQDGQAWLARMDALAAAGTGRQLVVVRRSDECVIGTLLLFKHDLPSARVELGYVLGRAHWRQGLMLEAVTAACGHAFGPMGIRRIEAEVNPANLASCRLLLRVGFTKEGTLRQRWVANDVPYDTHLFGLLASDQTAQGG